MGYNFFIPDSVDLASANLMQLASKTAVLCDTTRSATAIGCCKVTEMKVTEFGADRKPVGLCDFLFY